MNRRLVDALVAVGKQWRDPSYEVRERAVQETLGADNRFTEESVAFAVNHLMHQLTRETIERWSSGRVTSSPKWIGVVPGGRTPLEGCREMLAVLLTGHRFIGRLPPESPVLLRAFADDLLEKDSDLNLTFTDSPGDLYDQAGAIVASGGAETNDRVRREAEKADIAADRLLIRPARYGIAVVDGREDEEARSGLAEDMLLFEGESPCSVALLWAPRNHSPDPYLEMLPQFREVFPPHEDTDGSLAMPRAFLEARDQGHAYGAGFLVSRGQPEVQRGAHVRWTEYEDCHEVDGYIADHRSEITLAVADPRLQEQLDAAVSLVEPGTAHRRPLDWEPHEPDLVDWLLAL